MCDDKNDSPKNYKSTPPPTNKKVRNPFDRALIERLHKPLCSPSMCKVYKKKQKSPFRWDIDQACTLVPADIVECNSQYEPSPDPMLEKIAEEATERFFSQEMVMPSPIESSKKVKPLLMSSTESSLQVSAVIKETTVVMKDVSAQTVLTLPPELPPELEKLLTPFCTYTQDQNISGDYEITANGSLRRKLLFEEHSDIDHNDSEHTDDEIVSEKRPPSSFEAHTPVSFSPDIDQNMSGDYELTANGSLRRKLLFEEHSDIDHNEDSEHSDDEIVSEERPPSSFEAHTPVVFSPDLSQNCISKGMKRTFGTPLSKCPSNKPCYRNKILDVDFGDPCFSPIQFKTPHRSPEASSSVASESNQENIFENPHKLRLISATTIMD